MIVTGPWSAAVEDAVRARGITALELNIAKGWRGDDVAFLERLPHLESLAILDPHISDVSPIHALSKLRYLDVNTYCKTPIDATRFPALEHLMLEWRPRSESVFAHPGIAKLFINKCPIASLEPLAGMAALRELTLASPRLVSVHGIEALTRLELLGIHVARRLATLDGIEGAPQLVELEVTDSRGIRDLAPLAALRRLRRLNLDNIGEVESFAPLAGLVELERVLFCESTNVRDGDLSPLAQLPALRQVAFQERRHYSHQRTDFER